MPRAKKFEYRLLWRYKGSKRVGSLMAQRQLRILRFLRRIGTTEPWRGATTQALRKGWMRLSLMCDLPFSEVADLPAKDVMARIQRAYPDVDFIRVEYRQVGEWTEMIDPLTYLESDATNNADRRLAALYAQVEGMTEAQLNNWRLTPPEMRGDHTPPSLRKRHSYAKPRKAE